MPGTAMEDADQSRFWLPNQTPGRPKSVRDPIQMLLGMKKVKIMILWTPPLQNHYFWGPKRAKMNGKIRLEVIF